MPDGSVSENIADIETRFSEYFTRLLSEGDPDASADALIMELERLCAVEPSTASEGERQPVEGSFSSGSIQEFPPRDPASPGTRRSWLRLPFRRGTCCCLLVVTRSWTFGEVDLLTFVALDVLAGHGDLRMLDGGW
ncbi:hypothetical protein MRX96_040589 [Rhipicephalus microplus]